MNLIICLLIVFAIIGGCIIYLWRWHKNKYLRPISSSTVYEAADRLGVSDKKLDPPTMPGSADNIYKLHLRNRNEQAFIMTMNAQFFAILSSVAAIITLIGAIAMGIFHLTS